MNIVEQILLFLYYPQFHSPNVSRFESFFQSISKKDLSSNKNKSNKSRAIYPEKIVRNEDKRTSLLIKGIPPDISKKEVRNILEQYGNINYLYITKNLLSDDNTSIAFVNVINYKTIIPLFMNLRNYKFNSNGKIYNIKIMYSSIQGKKQLKHYIKQAHFCEYFE